MRTGGVLRQFTAGGAVISNINHYRPLTMKQLGRILRTGSANIAGSSGTASLINSSVLPWLYAIGNDRFAVFARNGSNYAVAGVIVVGASSITIGTFTALRAASATMACVRQNPKNPLQFAICAGDNYTHVVTFDATGTSFTTSSHNTGGTVTGLAYGERLCDIAWAEDGASFITTYENGTTARVGIALFTVSGTTLSYVTNTNGSNAIASINFILAELTGEASNETVISATRAATNGHIMRITWTTSAITIAMQAVDTDGTNSVTDCLPFVMGHLHIYPQATSPYPTARKVFDGSGSGQVTSNLPISNGGGLTSYYSRAPFGRNMNWDCAPDSSPYPTYPALQGLGCSGVGPNSLATRDISTDAMGFCVSHDYSTSILVVRNGTTWTFRGFNTPTS